MDKQNPGIYAECENMVCDKCVYGIGGGCEVVQLNEKYKRIKVRGNE